MAGAGVAAVLRELGRLAGSPDSAPAVEQLAAVLAYAREGVAREQVGPGGVSKGRPSYEARRGRIGSLALPPSVPTVACDCCRLPVCARAFRARWTYLRVCGRSARVGLRDRA